MPTAYSRETMNLPPLGPFLDPQRVAVIGGATGMGASTVRLLRESGRKVAAIDVNPVVLESPAEFSTLGDVTDADDIKRAIDEAAEALGALEAIVCCVGVNGFGTIEEIEPEEWHRQFAVNAFGPYACARAALPHLRNAGGGAIVVLTSQVGIVGQQRNAAYCPAKAAAIHLVRCMAIDYAAESIRVNAVCPGITGPTGMFDSWLAHFPDDESREAEAQRQIDTNLQKRIVHPDEVAAAAIFAVSNAAPGVIGQTIVVDGGYSIH
ncbi:MAG TPA: SDR family oxidoreductase [Baekduia sp.]|nr:SDR family oxidoreductase [Baekduia sp.]